MTRRDLYTTLKRLDAAHAVTRAVPWLTAVVRFLTGVLYRALELGLRTRHPHVRVEHQARILADQQPPQTGGPKVVFLTLRGWFAHVATEAVLAGALRARGARPEFLLCGGLLEQCDFKPPSDPFVTRPLCWRCTGFARRLLDGAALPHRTMSDLIDVEAERRLAQRRVRGLNRDELLRFVDTDGMELGALVVPSVQRGLLSGTVPDDPASVEILRGYLASAIVSKAMCAALLEASRPDVVVMTNGLFFVEAIMLRLARSQGVRVITYERGIPPNTIIVGVNEPVVPFRVDPYWRGDAERSLTPAERARVDALLDRRMRGDVGVQDIWPRMEADGRAILERLGLGPDRPTTIAFTNILWDTAVFERDIAFRGMFDWVEETVRTFAGLPDQQLVIRVHPAEVRLEMRRSREQVAARMGETFRTLPDNVALVPPDDPASSYALMGVADRVLTYTSTIGVEAGVLGHRVVVAGDTHYRGRGFTHDVTTREEYRRLLAGHPRRDGNAELARRYANTFFFRFMRPFPWVDDRSRAARSLDVTLGDLAPAADPRIDELCDLILGETDLPLQAIT